jgi:hypothetical protein
VEAYKDAFDYFDWNRSGTIPTKVKHALNISLLNVASFIIYI